MGSRISTQDKGDCIVGLGGDTGALEIQTKNERLLAAGLRAVVEGTMSALGMDVPICVTDAGALDYVIAARVEAAGRMACSELAPLRPSVERATSERDRPRRSRLYAPGNRPRFLAGIEVHGADCVLIDLEDSVPLPEKLAARILVKHLLSAVRFTEEVWVRINPLSSDGLADLEEAMIGRPHGICLPKAESAHDVRKLSEALLRMENEQSLEGGTTWIMPILETARGILHAEEIAAADPRVVLLAFGAEDFTRDVGARRSAHSLLFARSTIVAAAAAAGIQASDTVFSDLEDEEGLVAECALARELGFDGKGAINPRQLPAIHRAFSPTAEEIENARRVVAAAEEAEIAGAGAVALDGRMVARPVVDRARRTIRYADRLAGRRDP